MSGTTIFLGAYGYVKVGYLPEICEDDELELHLRVLIVLHDTNILLSHEEVQSFFKLLRGEEDNSPGEFILKKNDQSSTVLFKKYELSLPNIKVMEEILSLEDIIVGHIFLKHILREEITNEIRNALEEAIKECHNFDHIKYMACNTSDGFIVELATNFFDFFRQYWQLKYDSQL